MRNATHKAVSLMGYSKDTLRNQVSTSTAQEIVTVTASTGANLIEVATPMDLSMSGDSPKTIREYAGMWGDLIHNETTAGVVWRGTYNDYEGLYDVAKLVGASRIDVGTPESAPTDGQSTWYGRFYEWCTSMADHIETGDWIGFIPEATGHGIFSDNTSFLPHTAPGVQTRFTNFFSGMKTVVNNVMATQGKTVFHGSAQNYSEFNSGWLQTTLANNDGAINIDHYGVTHTHEEMYNDLHNLWVNKGGNKPIRLHEWGDYWHPNMDEHERLCYLWKMYMRVYGRLIEDGEQDYFGYWRASTGSQEGILKFQDGHYKLNKRGELLKYAWANTPTGRMPIL